MPDDPSSADLTVPITGRRLALPRFPLALPLGSRVLLKSRLRSYSESFACPFAGLLPLLEGFFAAMSGAPAGLLELVDGVVQGRRELIEGRDRIWV